MAMILGGFVLINIMAGEITNPQEYLDKTYGINKKRDSKDNHGYYLGVIGNLLSKIKLYELRCRRAEGKIKDLEIELKNIKRQAKEVNNG